MQYIEDTGALENGEPTSNARLKNHSVAFMFDEIRYEVNGLEIDRTRHLGVTSTVKNYVSLNTL